MSLILQERPDNNINIYTLVQKGLTQWEIARRLNINQSTVSRYIRKFGIPKIKPSRINEYRPRRYDKYLYCTHCKWIPINDVVTNLCNGIKYSYCPKCNKKIRENAKSSKYKRKEVKRI